MHKRQTKKTRRTFRQKKKQQRIQRGAARFFHYSGKPIIQLRDIPSSNINRFIMKPNGLWLSEEDSWKEWCSNQSFLNLSKCHKYEVTIDTSKLYIVDSLESLNALQVEYFDEDEFAIDWAKLAKKYAGIQFTNYKSLKNDLMKQFNPESAWFLSVDIDSVCIWRPSEAVLSISEISLE